MRNKDSRDIIGGLGLAAVGLFAVIYGQRYEFGDLNRMGPGYFPIVLGSMLAGLGVLIALPAFFRCGEPIIVAWKTFSLVMGDSSHSLPRFVPGYSGFYQLGRLQRQQQHI